MATSQRDHRWTLSVAMTSAVVFLAAGNFVACSASSGGGPSDGDGGAYSDGTVWLWCHP